MLPDRSILIGKKLVEIAKLGKFKSDISGDFQTMEVRLGKVWLGLVVVFWFFKWFLLVVIGKAF